MFQPKIKSCIKNCKSLEIKDITGFYDEELNPGGYDLDGLFKESVTEAILIITTPDGQVYEEDVTDVLKDSVFSSYTIFEYLNIKDGIYNIKLVIKTPTQDYEVTIEPRIYCSVECCVDKIILELADNCCNPCNNDKLEKANLAFMLLQVLKSECSSNSEFNKSLIKLQKICNETGCGC
jgi:hypothetical protein